MEATALILAFVIGLILQPGPGGIASHGTSPRGVRYVVTQQWNGWDNGGEPYTVRLYTRAAGGDWQAYYIDHEARRWKDCKIGFSDDGSVLEMTGGDRVSRTFELSRGEKAEAPPFLPPEREEPR
jgi:hypothetical protein